MRGIASAPDPYILTEQSAFPAGGNKTATGKIISTPRLTAGETTAVLMCFGQSNSANSGDTLFTPTNSTKVDNFNVYDGGTYRAVDPLLGCGNVPSTTGGNLWSRVADKLVTAGTKQRVILATIGMHGGGIDNWRDAGSWGAAGPLLSHLLVVRLRLLSVGLTPSAYTLMIGESDNQSGMSRANWLARGQSLVAAIQTLGDTAPWFIGKCTYISGAVSTNVQNAQDDLVAAITNGHAGANTDTLTGTATNRQATDDHFKAAGANAAADLWVTALTGII